MAEGFKLSERAVERTARAVREVLGSPRDLRGKSMARFGGEIQRVMRLKVTAVGDDVLICARWDGENLGSDTFPVAKPTVLRRSVYDTLTIAGITYTYSDSMTREATDGTDTESQVVIPEYIADPDGTNADPRTIIYVVPMKTEPYQMGEVTVSLLDLNVDARAWAKDDEE